MDEKKEEEVVNDASTSVNKSHLLKKCRHVSFEDDVIEADQLRIALENLKIEEIEEKRENGPERQENEDEIENDVFEEATTQIDVETSHVDDGDDEEEPRVSFIIEWKTAIKIMISLMSTFEKILFFLGILSAFFLGLISPYVIYAYGSLIEAFIVHARLLKDQKLDSNTTQFTLNVSQTTLPTLRVFKTTTPTLNVSATTLSTFNLSQTTTIPLINNTFIPSIINRFINLSQTTVASTFVLPEADDGDNNTILGISLYEGIVEDSRDASTIISDDDLYPETTAFALGMAILGLTAFVVGFIMVVCLCMATESFMYRFRQNVLQTLLHRDLTWFEQQDMKQLRQLMEVGLNRFEGVLGENLGLLICLVTTVLGCVVEALIYGWKLALVLFCLLPLYAVAAWFFSREEFKYSKKQEKECETMQSSAKITLASIRTVAAFSGEAREIQRFGTVARGIRLIGEKKGWICGLILAAMALSKHIAFSIAYWYGTTLTLQTLTTDSTEYTTKEVYIVLFSAFVAALTTSQLIPYVVNIRRAAPASILALELLQTKSIIDSSSSEGLQPQLAEGTVSFENVSFRYPIQPDIEVLRKLSLQVQAGDTVAIVGPSKGGKTTIFQLLQRFYDPTSGQITLDGHNLRDINVGWLRAQVACVDAQPVLFSTTIRENIRYGRQNATITDIELAAVTANAHEFIIKLPQQYDTIVGEHGTILTDSQKQRVAIARALIRNPKILLLDGATAKLDAEPDSIVMEALEKARESRTTFIVPYRISSIMHIDNIVVMNDGKVVEIGDHSSLMRQKGVYYQQFKDEIKNDKPEVPEWLEDEYEIEKPDIDENVESQIDTGSDRGRLYPVSRIRINKHTNWMDASEFRVTPTLLRILNTSSPYFFFASMGYLGAFAVGLLFVVFTVILGHYLGLLAQDVDKITTLSKHYSIVTVVVGFFAGLFAFLQNSFSAFYGERVANCLRKQMFASMLHQEMTWFDDPLNNPKWLSIRLHKDPFLIKEMLTTSLGKLVQITAMTAAAALITIIYSWKIALVASMFAVLVVFITCLQAKVNNADSALQYSASEAAGKIASESLSYIKTLASLNAENVVLIQYKTALERVHSLSLDMYSIRGLLFGIMRCSPLLLYSAVNSLGGHLIMFFNFPHQKVIVIQQLTEAAFFAMAQAVPLVFSILQGLETAHRIFQLLDRKPRIDSSIHSGFMLPIRSHRTINIENAVFTYPMKKSVDKTLQNATFEIPEGKTTAIVGPANGGKTTCISLILRFYDPQNGSVVMDQIDMQNLNVPWLRSQMAVISHDSLLLHRTILENIAYGDNMRHVKQTEIEQATKAVNIHTLIKTLPNSYNTVLGDCDQMLTNLQKFQISAARAILRKPKIILVDDVMLTKKEDRVKGLMEVLDKIKNGRTCVLVSQSVLAAKSVDWVVVLRNKVLESGTPTDLLGRDSNFSLQWYREEQSQSRRTSLSTSGMEED